MKKEEFITRYGEDARQKMLEQGQAWREDPPEEAKALAKAWRDDHPDQVKENHNQGNRKGGKYYKKVLVAQRVGLQGEKIKDVRDIGESINPLKT